MNVYRRRSLTHLLVLPLLIASSGLAWGCSPTQPPSAPAGTAATGLTPVPGGSDAGEPPTQTDTAWGRVWDALPPAFPIPKDVVAAPTRGEPVSGEFAIGASGEDAAKIMVAALQGSGYSIESASGPAEDGSTVIEAVGTDPECRVQVRVTPLSGTTHLTVLFGAACPFQ